MLTGFCVFIYRENINMSLPIIYQMHILVTGLIFVAILLIALEGGYQFGRWSRKHKIVSSEKEYKDLVLTAMYALLGLMLAFTYTFTLSRADMRKQALIDEANAIGTAFLRAEMLEEPTQTELRIALLEYARTRVIRPDIAGDNEKLKNVIDQSNRAQARIWPVIQQMLDKSKPGPVEVSIVHSMNDLYDIGTKRLAVSFDQLPFVLLIILLFLTCTSLALTGFNAGLSGKMNRGGLVLLVIFLSVVILIITDFDRSFKGFVQISQQSLLDVINGMERLLASGVK